jgi:hypothetical protein
MKSTTSSPDVSEKEMSLNEFPEMITWPPIIDLFSQRQLPFLNHSILSLYDSKVEQRTLIMEPYKKYYLLLSFCLNTWKI